MSMADQLKKMNDEQIKAEIGNKAYAGVIEIFEALEHMGKLSRNGHHAAQQVADYAIGVWMANAR